jgi:N,N-dimethylformamidase
MRIVGYADRLAASPGEDVAFKVSCEAARYDVELLRLWHGDINPEGPGFKADSVGSPVNRSYPGRRQPIHPGSYVRIADEAALLGGMTQFSLCCWAFPTLLGGVRRGLLTRWSAGSDGGYGLFIGAEGDLTLMLGTGRDTPVVVRTKAPLAPRRWYFLAASIDLAAGSVSLYQLPREDWPDDPARAIVREAIPATTPEAGGTFLIGAAMADPIGAFFNGKIDRPAVFSRVLAAAELQEIREGRPPWQVDGSLATWDFSIGIGSSAITDRTAHGLHGRAVNLPTRGATGHNWSGVEERFSVAADGHGAIHFHDDDLDDAGWQTDFTLTIPAERESGIYAARLAAGGDEDFVPFIVRPAKTAAPQPIAFLVPTLTYIAYGCEHLATTPGGLLASHSLSVDDWLAAEATPYEQSLYRYTIDQRLHSLYDLHADGSGVCYASRLRPLVNIRPRFNKSTQRWRHPHMLSCDLYIADWMRTKGFAHDTIDDEYLHAEGASLLSRYRVVVTGHHPEYWSTAMLDALRAWLAGGGRLLYLGGNGFYWVTTVDPERGHAIEVRRGFAGVRAWTSEPGEQYHSMTGELGGLWRFRGHSPQSIVGTGFSAYSGLARARPYRRTKASYDPSVAFIFEGVDDEIIGDFGLHSGGAAGWEIDSVDSGLGTPPHAVVLASSFDHSSAFRPVIEECRELTAPSDVFGPPAPRADLTYVAGPNDGAVFSVSSMTWCGSLSHNNYDNNVSRITENVLRAFSSAR